MCNIPYIVSISLHDSVQEQRVQYLETALQTRSKRNTRCLGRGPSKLCVFYDTVFVGTIHVLRTTLPFYRVPRRGMQFRVVNHGHYCSVIVSNEDLDRRRRVAWRWRSPRRVARGYISDAWKQAWIPILLGDLSPRILWR